MSLETNCHQSSHWMILTNSQNTRPSPETTFWSNFAVTYVSLVSLTFIVHADFEVKLMFIIIMRDEYHFWLFWSYAFLSTLWRLTRGERRVLNTLKIWSVNHLNMHLSSSQYTFNNSGHMKQFPPGTKQSLLCLQHLCSKPACWHVPACIKEVKINEKKSSAACAGKGLELHVHVEN